MSAHFSTFLKTTIGKQEHQEVAANCGISASQLCKVLQGGHCERSTLAKIFSGISQRKAVRAECMAAYMRDLLILGGDAGEWVRITVRK